MADDPTPPDPGPSSKAGGVDVMLWLGVLVILAAVVVLVLQRRARGSGGIPTPAPARPALDATQPAATEPAPEAPRQAVELERVTPSLAIAGAPAAAGGQHSHKRIRRHPELQSQNGAAGSLTNADV